jgi:hypothetical protein
VGMHLIVIDFETYYDKQYTLSELTTTEYVLHKDFQVIGFSYSLDGSTPQWHSGDFETLAMLLRTLPWEDAVCIAHHAFFDAAILEWKFDIHPAKYFCTMMGSRPYVAPHRNSATLATVADHLQIGQKGSEVYKAIGKRLEDFGVWELLDYGKYCSNDVKLTADAAAEFMRRMPQDEQEIVDLTVKKFTRPQLQLDRPRLELRLDQIQNDKAKSLLTLPPGCGKDDLMSNDKFAEAVKRLGVQPGQKISLTTGQMSWAFAKTDQFIMEMRTHVDPQVRALAEARLLWKSTLEESRIERFIAVSTVTDWLPVALLYYGAHTGRGSGFDKLNLQNLPRGGELRKAIVAPPGHKIVTVDLSQIEARIVAMLEYQWDLIYGFRNNEDIYSAFASLCYGYPVDKVNFPVERFVGKTCILGLGYGMGAAKLLYTLLASAAKYGIPLQCTLQDCERWVKLYRTNYNAVPKLWRQMERLLKHMCEPRSNVSWQMLSLQPGKCVLPNGMELVYPGISLNGMNQIQYYGFVGKAKTRSIQKMWGGAFLENVCQALAQIIIKRAELRLAKHGLFAALQVHDELVYVVEDSKVDRVKRVLEKVLTDPVPWLAQLPLACEVGVGQNYGDAK